MSPSPKLPARVSGSPWLAPALVGVLLLLVAVLAGGGEEPEGEGKPARPTPSPAATVSPVLAAAAPPVRAAAAALSVPEQVAQLFLVERGSRDPRWGAVSGPRRAGGRGSDVPPLVVARALPVQTRLGGRPVRAVRRAYRRAGARLQRRGVRLGLGLSADVGTTAGPLAEASFGDDPDEVAARVRAALDGLGAAKLPAALGHFPGQGAASSDPLEAAASVGLTRDALEERDLVPFRAALPQVPAVVVTSAVLAAFDPTTPAALSPAVVRDQLRDRFRYTGVVLTDDLRGLTIATSGEPGPVAVAALRAGVDMVHAADAAAARAGRRAVLAALRSGELSPARVQEALARVLELKRRAGLLKG